MIFDYQVVPGRGNQVTLRALLGNADSAYTIIALKNIQTSPYCSFCEVNVIVWRHGEFRRDTFDQQISSAGSAQVDRGCNQIYFLSDNISQLTPRPFQASASYAAQLYRR